MEDIQNTGDPWLMSRLGFAVDAYVHKEINKSTRIADSGAYGLGDDGQLYNVGQPSMSATVAPRQPINTTFLLLVLAAVYLATQK